MIDSLQGSPHAEREGYFGDADGVTLVRMACRVISDPHLAARALRRGKLVALPTETVYGLGADATNATAVARLFAAKERPLFDPLILHLASRNWLTRVVSRVPAAAERMAKKFWPGPLTLVLPKQPSVLDLVTSDLPTVAVRVPRHKLMQAVIAELDRPVAAPSANRFGQLSPTRPEHVAAQLWDSIDYILDGGKCRVGLESTILQVDDDNQVTLLRAGGLSLERIEAVVGPVQRRRRSAESQPAAPGMLPQHYAPRTPLRLVKRLPPSPPRGSANWGVLAFRSVPCHGYRLCFILSDEGNLVTAAARFFDALHFLDRLGLDLIVAVEFPNEGLGRAINDRLRRAAHRHDLEPRLRLRAPRRSRSRKR
jgi:L-threonylcarbamoyladenylate synthase